MSDETNVYDAFAAAYVRGMLDHDLTEAHSVEWVTAEAGFRSGH